MVLNIADKFPISPLALLINPWKFLTMAEGGPPQTLPWECLICSSTFPSKSSLRRHVTDTYPILELWLADGHMDDMKSCVMCQQVGAGQFSLMMSSFLSLL